MFCHTGHTKIVGGGPQSQYEVIKPDYRLIFEMDLIFLPVYTHHGPHPKLTVFYPMQHVPNRVCYITGLQTSRSDLIK